MHLQHFAIYQLAGLGRKPTTLKAKFGEKLRVHIISNLSAGLLCSVLDESNPHPPYRNAHDAGKVHERGELAV